MIRGTDQAAPGTSFRLAVATTTVASVTGKDGDDFVGEADGENLAGTRHLDPAIEAGSFEAGGDGGFAICKDADEAPRFDPDDSLRSHRIAREATCILVRGAASVCGQNELVEGMLSAQGDLPAAAPGESWGIRDIVGGRGRFSRILGEKR